jgi:hypothetical protein
MEAPASLTGEGFQAPADVAASMEPLGEFFKT